MPARQLKVAMVYQGDGGGVYDYASHVANAMSPMLDLTVFTNTGPRILNQSVKVIRVSHVWTRMFNPSYFLESFRIARKLSRLRPDVIHMQHFYPLLPYFLLTRSRPPLVLTLHETKPVNRYGGPYGAFASLFLWRVYFLASRMIRKGVRIIVLSNSIKAELRQDYPGSEERTDVIPYPIFPIAEPRQTNGVRTILFFGNMWWTRGLDILLRAMLAITPSLGQTKLVIAGGGRISGDNKKLIEKCREYCSVEVRNYFVPGGEAERLFRESTFVVLPYRIPTSSAALNTAYSYCKPVIASRLGYLAEMVRDGETGILFDVSDTSGLASSIRTLLGDEKLVRKMQANISEMRRSYSPEKIARMHIATYSKAVSRR